MIKLVVSIIIYVSLSGFKNLFDCSIKLKGKNRGREIS